MAAFEVDSLALLAGKPIRITDKIVFNQAKLQEVITYGEKQYYQILTDLTVIPSDLKSVLWDAGIDWMEFSDLELFYAMARRLPVDQSSIFFPKVDFSKFILLKNEANDLIMYDQDNDIKIDVYVYKKMQDCLCKSHGIKKKVEKAGNKYTKQILIDEDRQNRERNRDKPFESRLFGLVSGLVNYAGFKYNYQTVWDLTMFQFMDAVQRVRLIDSTTHLLEGIYAGTVDSTKIRNEKMDWMREIRSEN